MNVPVVALAMAVAGKTVHESVGPPGRRLDLAGTALGACLLGLVTFAFIEGGRRGLSTSVIVAVVGAAAVAICFVETERRREDPMLPLGLFRRTRFSAADTVARVMNFSTLGLLFILTLYLQDMRHRSPLEAGLELLPLFVPLSVIAPLGGRLTARWGSRVPMMVGTILAATG
ncbi:MAG: hypothetical protein JO240_00505 [Solirubrobacterales bacterium]|nr:hypothetical protein [Solirubrobacterales bacterium]